MLKLKSENLVPKKSPVFKSQKEEEVNMAQTI